MLYYIKLVVKGFFIGIANIIPGVSGGTAAFILGIYEELIRSIKSIDLKFAKMIFQGKFKEALDYVKELIHTASNRINRNLL